MKKLIAFILCAAALVCALAACSNGDKSVSEHHPDGVEIVKDKSALIGDVERSGNNVVMHCRLTIENTTDKTAAVKLAANFPEEYRRGWYAIDFAVGKVDDSEMVAVPANDTVEVEAVFEIPLKQGYTGEQLKVDSELPAIAINEIEIDSDLLPPMD